MTITTVTISHEASQRLLAMREALGVQSSGEVLQQATELLDWVLWMRGARRKFKAIDLEGEWKELDPLNPFHRDCFTD